MDFTTIRSLGDFEYCPACGSELEKDEKQIGTKVQYEVRCPEHGKLTFPHTGLHVKMD